MVTTLTSQYRLTWLEWAGAGLNGMPSGRIKPAEPHVIWPEYSQDKFEILDYRVGLQVRAAAPSSAEIPIVDEILLLPNICSWETGRKLLHARSLVHPIHGRYRYNWSDLAKLLKSDRRTVKVWHQRSLVEVAEKVDPAKVCHIAAFFDAAISAYERARAPQRA